MGISDIKIDMPSYAKVSIFTDNDLTHRLLNQIYIVPLLPPGYDYDNLHSNVMDELTPSTSPGATASVPPFSFTA